MDDFFDLNRRIESLLREGTVIDVDHGVRRVRVESGGLKTDWIRWLAQRTGSSIESKRARAPQFATPTSLNLGAV